MSDRELLEDAAKAAGYVLVWGDKYKLGDDEIDCNYCCAMALDLPDRDWWGGGEDERAGVAHDECDPLAATRRAIVRAAAEIGRSMK